MKICTLCVLYLGFASIAQGQHRLPVGDIVPPGFHKAWGILEGRRDSLWVGDSRMQAAATARAFDRADSPNPPTCHNGDVSCLTDGFTIQDYNLEWDAAVKLGLVLGNVAGNVSKKVFIHDLMFTKPDVDAGGNPITWGSGVRLVIIASANNSNANFSSLPAIAASAEFKYTEAKFDFRTVGVAGPKITGAIPPAASYNIDTHVNLMRAVDKIRDAMADATTVITPRVVSITVLDVPYFSDRVARMWAWHSLMKGMSCSDAKKALGGGHTPDAEASLESEYRSLTKQCDNKVSTDLNLKQTLSQAFVNAGIK